MFQPNEQCSDDDLGKFQHDWIEKSDRVWQHEHDPVLERSVVHSLSRVNNDCLAQYADRNDGKFLPTNWSKLLQRKFANQAEGLVRRDVLETH